MTSGKDDAAMGDGRPAPMRYFLVGLRYGGDSGNQPEEIAPEEIAMWAHCGSGLTSAEFLAWMAGELALLEAIDPECSK